MLEANLQVPFPTARQAEIAYNSLRVDGEPKRSGLKKSLTLDGDCLKVNFACAEARTLRVSVNSFFDLLVLVTKTMDQFDY